MSVHQLFPATRPARMPTLFPDTLDALLGDRHESIRLAGFALLAHPQHIAMPQAAWADRLTARIAQVTA